MERSCQANQGDRVWFNCVGEYADTLEELDELWQAHDFRITVDNRPVDLASFGTVDMTATWDSQVTVRLWNVEIENLTAGQHEIVCQLEHEGEHSESHWLFAVQEEQEALDTLPAEAVPGQRAYTSEVTGLDFLIYFPEEYGQDPAREWPLILFLHGFVDGLQSID